MHRSFFGEPRYPAALPCQVNAEDREVVPLLLRRVIAPEILAIDVFFGHQAPRAAVIGGVSIVSHNKVVMQFDEGIGHSVREAGELRPQVWLLDRYAVDEHLASVIDTESLAGQTHDALDESLRGIVRIPKGDNVASTDLIDLLCKEDSVTAV